MEKGVKPFTHNEIAMNKLKHVLLIDKVNILVLTY